MFNFKTNKGIVYLNKFSYIQSNKKVMKLNKMYVVTAYRWGEIKEHNYVVGVYSSNEKAVNAAGIEYCNRGGKYECHVTEHELDFIDDLEDLDF